MNRKTRTGLIIGGLALALLIAIPVLLSSTTGQGVGCWGPVTGGMMGGLSIGWLMPVISIVFLALVVWAIIALIEGLGGHKNTTVHAGETATAMETLQNMYARGEISRREYLARKKDLTGS